MQRHFRVLTVAGIVGFISPMLACASSQPLTVKSEFPAEREQIVVVGQGRVELPPDMAKATFGVMTRGESAAVAMRSVSDGVQRLISLAKSHGIAEVDIRTVDVSLYEERNEVPQEMPTKMGASGISSIPAVHYVARNTVEITVRDISKLGPVLGAVLDGGANQMHGIEFGLVDPAPSRIQARTLAIADAKRQAQQMADAAGVKLGRVLAIRSSDASGATPSGGGMRAEAFSSKVAVSGGTLNIEESVELRFELVAP